MSDYHYNRRDFVAPQYTIYDLPSWLTTILAEMKNPKHGRRFASCTPPDEWLIKAMPIWQRVHVRGKQLWFLSIKDYKMFADTNSLNSAAVAAGYELKCRELPGWLFEGGKPKHITLDPLHIIPEWIINNEINNERKTA